jgi:site-specific recombinase XerD
VPGEPWRPSADDLALASLGAFPRDDLFGHANTDVHPAAVRFQHLELYLGWLQHNKGVSARTANRHLFALKAFWRYLIREGVTTTNPPADVFLLPEPTRVPKRLSIPEQERVLAQLAQNRTPTGRRGHALIGPALFAGLRCQELAWMLSVLIHDRRAAS